MAKKTVNTRRKVLKAIGTTGTLLAGSGHALAADTEEKYPKVDKSIYKETVQAPASTVKGGFPLFPERPNIRHKAE